ncbi:hypothetical protein VKT23_014370 [Stygiomarasmius scandens]|uniref:HMG box domain-containing protein n=1 Tax=Marasmiellus scandens TaxID=2682957 RepID=A0ABR1J1U3_9AGAR
MSTVTPGQDIEPEGRVSFALNQTPISFTELGGLSSMYHSESALRRTSPYRPSHCKKKSHIPRPPNAFMLFCSAFVKNQYVSSSIETNHGMLSKIIGLTWQNLPDSEKLIWRAEAQVKREEHRHKFPGYKFQPLHLKAKKRKGREVEQKDSKRCEKIAELLVKGKKGEELDSAIQEFDKTHVPRIIPKFKAPLTQESFRPADEIQSEGDNEESIDASSEFGSPSRTNLERPAAFDQPLLASHQTVDSHYDPFLNRLFFGAQAENTGSAEVRRLLSSNNLATLAPTYANHGSFSSKPHSSRLLSSMRPVPSDSILQTPTYPYFYAGPTSLTPVGPDNFDGCAPIASMDSDLYPVIQPFDPLLTMFDCYLSDAQQSEPANPYILDDLDYTMYLPGSANSNFQM